ncbi:MAG TPA: hypothetical protein RMH99_17785, partial [Sandaracinaceae bacterium LLY-WYZ-13_1]|nr:hypothetical protein [Sandaracinaceae bacterium LLY-WYZ-13_1]
EGASVRPPGGEASDGASADGAPARDDGREGEASERERLRAALREARDDLVAWWAAAAAERGALERAEDRVASIHDEEQRSWMRSHGLRRYREAGFDEVQPELAYALRSGDGRAVALALVRDAWRHDLPTQVHRITRRRAELAQHLRWAQGSATLHCHPERALHRLVDALRVARGLGAEDWVAELEPRVRAHRDALARRDVAVLAQAVARHWYVYDGR